MSDCHWGALLTDAVFLLKYLRRIKGTQLPVEKLVAIIAKQSP
jgi:hypothetical protein